jgi:hypothetical protein
VVDEVYQLWTASLKLQAAPFREVQTYQGFLHSGLIFLLAAVSKGLSDAGIMMINRATKAQVVRGLLGMTLALACAALTWSACIWLGCRGAAGLRLPFRDILGLVLVSYAPLVFGFLAIVPHAGLFWEGVLKVWMLLITVAGMNLQYGIPLIHAVIASGTGWLLFHLLGQLFGSRVEKLRLRLLGRHQWVRPKDAAVALLEREMGGAG